MRFRSLLKCRSGSSAVEFALVSPLLFMTLFSLVGYGIYLGAAHSVQQVAADAARTAVAGLTDTERKQLVSDFMANSTLNYALLDKRYFTTTVQQDATNPNQFTVTVTYDASNLPIVSLYSFAMPSPIIRRFATMRMGGA